jgi:glycosyltransferase involved in cell wall biosynthesis
MIGCRFQLHNPMGERRMSTRSDPQGEPRVAVITPYYRESLEMLQLCHDSVRTQTFPCTHLLVADGYPRQEISSWSAQHLSLPQPHKDDGNTPRCLGSLSAMKQGYDVIVFLDADNWLYPNHLESLVNLQRQTGAAVCTATRSFHRLDGSLMYIDRHDSDGKRHVDTNCLFLTQAAFRVLPVWVMIPRQLYTLGDNLFWQALLAAGLKTAHHPHPTVAYRTPYQVHYRNFGEPAPPGTKSNEETSGKAHRWWHALPEEERQDWTRYLTCLSGKG